MVAGCSHEVIAVFPFTLISVLTVRNGEPHSVPMAEAGQGLAREPISQTQHRPPHGAGVATTASSCSDDVLSTAPSSFFTGRVPAASPVARSWPHCFPDTRLTPLSTQACPHAHPLRLAVDEVTRRKSPRTSRRNIDRRGSGQQNSAPAARPMHPHSFDSCSEGWPNQQDAAANAGLRRLRAERSGTMHDVPLADRRAPTTTHSTMHRRKRRLAAISPSTAICALLAGSIPTAMAQSCVSLADSTACQAFRAASVSTGSTVAGLFPFLSSVENVTSFDTGIESYIAGGFTQQR